MSSLSFSGLLIVAGVAFAIPLVLSLTPARSLPASILEIVAGIIIGPSGFGWVRVDAPIQLLSLIGLAFLLFIAGLEINLHRLKSHLLLSVSLSFLLSFGLALLVGYLLFLEGQVKSPLLFASPSTFLLVPLFFVALLLVRGLPALLYKPLVGTRQAIITGLLQATSLSFLVAATQIGMQLRLITPANGAALIAAGIIGALIFPVCAMVLLRPGEKPAAGASEVHETL